MINLIWILSIAPLLGAILQALISNLTSVDYHTLFPLMLLLNFGLVFYDLEKLKSNGKYTTEIGLPWIIPIYLYKRAKVFNQMPIYSIIWTVSYIFVSFISEDIIKEFVWKLTMQYG